MSFVIPDIQTSAEAHVRPATLVVRHDNGRLAVSAPGRVLESLAALMHTLPDGRPRPKHNDWTCLATPLCAYRLVGMSGVNADSETHKLSERWIEVRERDNASPPQYRHTDPWRHQAQAYNFAHGAAATMLALDMGTGKSKVLVDLLVNWGGETHLILCPLSVLAVWRRELERHWGYSSDVLVTVCDRGTVAKKSELAANDADNARRGGEAHVVVINYEAAWREPFAKWALARTWSCVSADESHRAKDPTGKSSKFLFDVGKRASRRLCLTGTPMPHSPLDLFAQYRFLDAAIFGTSYTRFRARYAKTNPLFPSKVEGWLNQEEFNAKYHSIAFRVTSEEVLDLPPAVHDVRYVELGKEARKAYADLENEAITEVRGGTLTAANALVKLLRLHQIACGSVGDDDGNTHIVDTAKADALSDLLSDLPVCEPVVVICRFKADVRAVRAVAESLGRKHGELSGSCRDLTPHGTMPEHLDLLAVNLQSGGVGIDLTRARYCVYYSVGFNLGDYEQSLARVRRPGQTRPVVYYHLIASNTVEPAIYGALRKRKQVVETVLDALKNGGGIDVDCE